MSRVCVRRDIDLPAGDLTDIVGRLSELSRCIRPENRLPVDTGVDYTAGIEVYDVVETGRVLVVWTVSFCAPDLRKCVAKLLEHTVFRDSIEQLSRELWGTPQIDPAL
jgi:hypothetical protein